MTSPKLNKESTVNDVMEFLQSRKFSDNIIGIFEENEVDGESFLELQEKDIFVMLPGKVGPARKLTGLLSRLKDESVAVTMQSKESTLRIEDSDAVDAGSTSNLENSATHDVEERISSTPLKKLATSGVATASLGPTIQSYMPDYSTATQDLLDRGEILLGWDKFIEETAYHVLSVGNFGSKGLYDDFGRLMTHKYPCVRFSSGANPWSYFNKVLSQKVRNIRWRRNKRSEMLKNNGEPAPKKRKHNPLVLADIDADSTMDVDDGNRTIKEELKKASAQQDKALILKAQRATFKNRRLFVTRMQEDGSIRTIIDSHPLLGIASYVEREFFLIKPNLSTKVIMMDRWTDLLTAFDKINKSVDKESEDEDEEAELLHVVDQIQLKIKLPSRSQKKLPDLIMQQTCTEVNLATGSKEAPRLVVIKTESGGIGSIYVVGDKIQMAVGADLKEALLILVFCYYVWDLSYPKRYPLLGLLQMKLLQDDAAFHKGANFIKFLKQLQTVEEMN